MDNHGPRKGEKEKGVAKDEETAPELGYPRRKTGVRILATLFFIMVIWSILETLVFAMVIFQIVYALIVTRPNFWLIGFANRTIAYFYRVMRCLTFNEDKIPFPFSRFPAEIEKPEMQYTLTLQGGTDEAAVSLFWWSFWGPGGFPGSFRGAYLEGSVDTGTPGNV
jgi:hypothetical protein